ncbi:carbohydrate ABC transporter permease [Chengkuizengella axinellae]|uniref:Sugar ABC transporter permease n=1 Tax=Chengkuizengella axinellae TaxID=3064388 RepID=A0ABT9IUF5_9BACL|nr:sugar ABC transporter permease [Chengkuizengella sp. 2205SS18-9]MDP5272995.1 sugar ABC transporter permease [Chengkuizengella sp. 2205SS18-9]
MSRNSFRETVVGYLFIGPLMIGMILFTLIPIAVSLILSFTDWSLVQGIKDITFVGFKNFTYLFQDPVFIKSVKNNLIFMLVVPITMAISVVLAVLLNSNVYMKGLFKVIFFIPYISSVVAIAMVSQVIFHPSYGPINELLRTFGIENPPLWLADHDYALITLMLITIWMGIGYKLIIYMAGLQNIPQELYEAADIDGASGITKFFKITLPLLSPTSFFLLITGIIASFKVFDIIVVLTEGGPSDSTSVMVFYLYKQAFVNMKTGLASASSIVLVLIVLGITLVQFLAQKKWVNY